MAYPFADNRYAQNSSNTHQSYNDPYESHQHAAPYEAAQPAYSEEQDSYDQEPRSLASSRDAAPAAVPYGGYPTMPQDGYSPQDDYSHQEKTMGRSPYETAPEMMSASPYAGKSIWTADDKRVMGKRNVPARIFR